MEDYHCPNLTTPILIGVLQVKTVNFFPSTAALGIRELVEQLLSQMVPQDRQAMIIFMTSQDTIVTRVMLAVYVFKLPENVAATLIIIEDIVLHIMAIQQMECTRVISWIKVEFFNMLTLD